MAFEDRRGLMPEKQIHIADQAGAGPNCSICAARGHRRDAIGEFRLPQRLPFGRDMQAVHGGSLNIHGRPDVVAAADILIEFIEQIAPVSIPEMVMRIDDRQFGREDLLIRRS